jgi:hypothetical protein
VAQVLGEQDQRRIGKIHWEVGVCCHQFVKSRCMSGGDFENIERAGSELLDKAQLRWNAAPSKQRRRFRS